MKITDKEKEALIEAAIRYAVETFDKIGTGMGARMMVRATIDEDFPSIKEEEGLITMAMDRMFSSKRKEKP